MKQYHYLWPQNALIDGRYYIGHREKRLIVMPFGYTTVRAAQNHINRMQDPDTHVVVEAAQIQSND